MNQNFANDNEQLLWRVGLLIKADEEFDKDKKDFDLLYKNPTDKAEIYFTANESYKPGEFRKLWNFTRFWELLYE